MGSALDPETAGVFGQQAFKFSQGVVGGTIIQHQYIEVLVTLPQHRAQGGCHMPGHIKTWYDHGNAHPIGTACAIGAKYVAAHRVYKAKCCIIASQATDLPPPGVQ